MPLHGKNIPRPLSKPTSLAIYGPGLIGGSILLAARRADPELRFRVWGRSAEALRVVQSQVGGQCIVSLDPVEVAGGADAVIFCTPVETMEELAGRICSAGESVSWFTDAGSVKGEMVFRLEDILGNRYVGAHPMAGSEKTGFENASGELFAKSVCILTPTTATDEGAKTCVGDFWESLGCCVMECDPIEHDALIAQVSHLPHLVAAALVCAAGEKAFPMAGSGFRDSTRIAMGEPRMWANILIENREAVLGALERLETRLAGAKSVLEKKDFESMVEFLQLAAEQRGQLF